MESKEDISEIVLQFAKYNSQGAFKKFFDMLYPRLLKYALYILESKSNAEDVVSGAFVKFWYQRKKLVNLKRPESYFFTSIKNLCYNYLRDNKEYFLKSLETESFEFITTFENPERQFLTLETKQKIQVAIDQLPPRCKLIFSLVREEGLKFQEVADLLDISVKTVEAQMTRALAKLRSSLQQHMSDELRSHLKISKSTK